MALSNFQLDSEDCCVAGIIYQTCTQCGGHFRGDPVCRKCNGSGSTASACPVHSPYNSASGYVTSNTPAYGNKGTHGGSPGYGQQRHGSTSGSGR